MFHAWGAAADISQTPCGQVSSLSHGCVDTRVHECTCAFLTRLTCNVLNCTWNYKNREEKKAPRGTGRFLFPLMHMPTLPAWQLASGCVFPRRSLFHCAPPTRLHSLTNYSRFSLHLHSKLSCLIRKVSLLFIRNCTSKRASSHYFKPEKQP